MKKVTPPNRRDEMTTLFLFGVCLLCLPFVGLLGCGLEKCGVKIEYNGE